MTARIACAKLSVHRAQQRVLPVRKPRLELARDRPSACHVIVKVAPRGPRVRLAAGWIELNRPFATEERFLVVRSGVLELEPCSSSVTTRKTRTGVARFLNLC